jgi:hypothetical protein
MAAKKTVKRTVKKRRKARKVVSIDSVVTTLQENAALSSVNKRAVSKLKKCDTAVERSGKKVATASERVTKATAAVAKAKTAAAKQNARAKVAAAREAVKAAKADLSAAVAEQKKVERLARGLATVLGRAQAKMAKEYDKVATAAEKSADKPRRRRARKKRVAKKA